MVLKKRGGIRRRLIMIASAGGSIADLVARLVARRVGTTLAPAAGRVSVPVWPVLIFATAVEALAPFIYAIF